MGNEEALEVALDGLRRFPGQSSLERRERYARIGLGDLSTIDKTVARWREEGINRLPAPWNLADHLWVHGHREKARVPAGLTIV